MVETSEKINLWAASHDEKWQCVPTKPEEKIQVHKKRERRGLHRPMLMDGEEGKILRKCCVVKDIEHQREKRGKNEGTTEDEGFLSPMSVTRPKQGIEEEGGDFSNVSKTILKQGLEGCLGYCANVPMDTGKTECEEGGVATCAQQWKTADIRKRKPAGMLHAEKKQQDFGAPPPPGECWSSLNPPMLSTDNMMMGANTNMLCKENWKNATAVRKSRDHNHIIKP